MSAAHVHGSSQLPPPTIQEVSDGIYAYLQPDGSWGLNNAGFIVGRNSVTVIDTCFTEARTKAFLEAVHTVTTLPLRTLLNTHHHGDQHSRELLAARRHHHRSPAMPRDGNRDGIAHPSSPLSNGRMGKPGVGSTRSHLRRPAGRLRG